MAGFDDLIKETLKKQDDLSKERRAVVYESARKALERMLAAKSSELPPEAIATQKRRLERAISDIERDYVAKDPKPWTAATEPAPALREPAVQSPPTPANAKVPNSCHTSGSGRVSAPCTPNTQRRSTDGDAPTPHRGADIQSIS